MKIVARMLTDEPSFRCYPIGSPCSPIWTEKFEVEFIEDDAPVPEGMVEYRTTNEKPELVEPNVLGYDCVVSDGRILKTYVSVRPLTMDDLKAALRKFGVEV